MDLEKKKVLRKGDDWSWLRVVSLRRYDVRSVEPFLKFVT
jgi:hypothetical protein